MRNRFDTQLEQLNNELITFGGLCEQAIGSIVEALLEDNKEKAREAIALEKITDNKEAEIESLCLRLLLQQQPVAKDLRLISSALKMITDLERIGDQAEDIGEIILRPEPMRRKNALHIVDMAQATAKMVSQSIDAFVRRDLALARQVMEADDAVDDMFAQVKIDLVDLISQNPENGEEAINILLIAKYFERIGDHAVNIAEWVEFSITGSHRRDDPQ
ncbi:MAG: phosphate signaling complex protein PhoU [Candidatus Riflebacteria bacterium]|nr:phosphate signaling complex protein PhoU [Candidatus Riflebacteria bacterium]